MKNTLHRLTQLSTRFHFATRPLQVLYSRTQQHVYSSTHNRRCCWWWRYQPSCCPWLSNRLPSSDFCKSLIRERRPRSNTNQYTKKGRRDKSYRKFHIPCLVSTLPTLPHRSTDIPQGDRATPINEPIRPLQLKAIHPPRHP